jgi:cytochrome c oxidase cbb3-type subunit 3
MTSQLHPRLLAVVVALLWNVGCEREDRPFSRLSPEREDTPLGSDGRPLATGPRHVKHNAFAVAEGQRLFAWFNCSGCHGGGGGGHIGPALTDAEWRYGASIEEVHHSIAEGRPRGMPAFRGLITDDQLWQLSAYVLSLGGRVPIDVAAGRNDGIDVGEAPMMRDSQPPRPERRP